MSRFLVDTSCMVASLCSWHPQRTAAVDEVNRRLARRQTMTIAAHSLAESYSALTRMPPPNRIPARAAWDMISKTFGDPKGLVSLDAGEVASLISSAAQNGIAGGQIYDALIAACAVKAGARAILTFNGVHFRRFETSTLQIVIPGT